MQVGPDPILQGAGGVLILPFDQAHQVRHIAGVVAEGVAAGMVLHCRLDLLGMLRLVVHLQRAEERQLLRTAGKPGGGDVVAEHVL